MSLIEQAAKRLEELRRAGADSAAEETAPASAQADAAKQPMPTPEAAVLELGTRPGAHVSAPRSSAGTEASALHAAPQQVQAFRPVAPRLDINLEELKRRGFVTPDVPRTLLADEYRIVKRPIIRNAVSRDKAPNANLVMVTSALAREGKTFTAVNLAMSIAMEMDTRVLLVDGDVAHPDLPNILGVRKAPGLLELLTEDKLDLNDVLVPTNIERLSILPAGIQQLRATELLASDQMANILRELSSRYADLIIIFDSPPLLPTTEARVLAGHMGQIVMVVAADSTRQHAVNLALATIESCPIVLMLLNKADRTEVGSYYGYYEPDQPRS
jgi:receptor protein-tyrosine kinase